MPMAPTSGSGCQNWRSCPTASSQAWQAPAEARRASRWVKTRPRWSITGPRESARWPPTRKSGTDWGAALLLTGGVQLTALPALDKGVYAPSTLLVIRRTGTVERIAATDGVTPMKAYRDLEARKAGQRTGHAMGILQWDQQTMMPEELPGARHGTG